jgi:hypothetical protein
MKPRLFLFLILLVMSWSVSTMPGADPCDPYASLDRRHSIACLAALRQPLDAAPDDQHLLGLAIQAYANLCLEILSEDCGIYGNWFAYAQELAHHRAALRQGREPATLAEAAPELWLRIIDGDTRSVVEAIRSYPAEADTPMARALYAAATRDHRIVVKLPKPTAHEAFAGWRAIKTICRYDLAKFEGKFASNENKTHLQETNLLSVKKSCLLNCVIRKSPKGS